MRRRKIHLATLQGFFEEVLKIALEAGAMKLGQVALDGTKIKANASKHKAMSWDRMLEQEQKIRQQVKDLLRRAAATDAEEDAQYGTDKSGDELPEELQRRESRLKRIKEAKKVLRQRAKEEAEAEGKAAEKAKPEDKAQYNFTDPESRIMKSNEGFATGSQQTVTDPIRAF